MTAQYFITDNLTEMDFSVIHGFIRNSYWAKNIPEDVLKKALAHSLCFGVMSASGEQVGFARMITDKATFTYLADVFILPEHRGNGLSKLLMQTIMQHHDLQGLRRMVLATKDAHGLYQQFGFKALANVESFMELWTPDIYQR